jgi:hypothetical protein
MANIFRKQTFVNGGFHQTDLIDINTSALQAAKKRHFAP